MATHPRHTLERLCTADLQEKADVAHGEALAGIRPPGVHPVPSCMSAVTAGSRSAHYLQGSSRASAGTWNADICARVRGCGRQLF